MIHIDRLLESLEWAAVPEPDRVLDDTPYATHEGTIDVLGLKLRVYRLSDGRAIIDEESLAALLSLALEDAP